MAPGWLDREEKILEPERERERAREGGGERGGEVEDKAGDELDRAFGGMGMGARDG